MMDSRTRRLDRHVGKRIRERRLMLGLTQADLAGKLGISYQQAHKYEIGTSKIAAGRLYEVAEHLDVPISYFYDEFTTTSAPASSRNRLCLELVRNFMHIKSESHCEAFTQFARALAMDNALTSTTGSGAGDGPTEKGGHSEPASCQEGTLAHGGSPISDEVTAIGTRRSTAQN